MKSRNTLIFKVNAVLMALYPVLDIYYFGNFPIGLGSILLFLSGLFSYLSTKPNLNIRETKYWILTLVLVSFLTYIIQGNENWFSFSLFWHNLIVVLLILFIIVSSGSRIDIQTFFKTGVIIGILASFICIYQRMMQIMTGSFDTFYIPGLSLGEAMEMKVTTLSRPAAFFTEPAHFCIYVIPMLCYSLFNKKPVAAVILSIGALASGSTTGFLLLGLLLVIFLMSSGSKRRKLIYGLLFVIAALLVIKYAPTVIQDNVDKFNETDVSEETRLLGGIMFWRLFSMVDVIFGIGLNQLESFAMSFSIITKNYSGALIYTFTCYGLFGLVATIIYLVSLFRKPNANYSGILIFIGVFCTDQILFNRNLVFLLIFVECMRLLNIQKSVKENVPQKKIF